MGEKPRPKPARLAEKLKEIRKRIDGGLTQMEMIKRLGFTDEELPQDRISKFERGTMEPNLSILCAYAEAANIYLEALAKDDLDLPPGNLPSSVKHEGIRHTRSSVSKQSRIRNKKAR
jgi:transcriptional regulator with XRE-family HTH domain